MDLKLSNDDRVTASGRKSTKKAAKKPVSKGTARRAKSRTSGSTRRKNTRKKGSFLGRLFRRTFYWGLVLGVWAFIAIAGVVTYYGMQLPSSDTWAVPVRPANIRILATNGQLISNRGKMGGEAVAYNELP